MLQIKGRQGIIRHNDAGEAGTMKLGRNQPCHCGSGRKYKLCCLAKDAEEVREAKELADRRSENVMVGRPDAFRHAIDRVRSYNPRKIGK